MAFDPVTAGIDLVKTFLNKFVSDKMSEGEKAALAMQAEMFVAQQSLAEDSAFRSFVQEYEGAAKDISNIPLVGPILTLLRSAIRPVFTLLVGYLDWIYFTGPGSNWTDDQGALLKAINIIVLMFWFGERAVKNSGIVELLLKRKA